MVMQIQGNVASHAAHAREAGSVRTTNEQDLGASQNIGVVVNVSAGQEIFEEGSEAICFYKVTSGVVRVCKFLCDGRRQIEAFHIAGEVFGLETAPRHLLTAEAVTDCTLISYRRRSVDQLATRDHEIRKQLLQYALTSLSHAQEHSLLLGRRGASEKVAAFLLSWAGRTTRGGMVHLSMTRQDIADYLGLTIETVSRSLSQLERDQIIALPGSRDIRVINNDALENLAA